jgi:hypothetical protein
MNIPGFTAEFALSNATLKWVQTSSTWAKGAIHSGSPHRQVVPAAAGNTEQAYRDCLTDCRLAGQRNCEALCAKGPPSESSPPARPVHPYDLPPECLVPWLSQPFIAPILDGAIKSACQQRGVTNAECILNGTFGASLAAFGIGALGGGVWAPIAGADLSQLSKCLCNYYCK